MNENRKAKAAALLKKYRHALWALIYIPYLITFAVAERLITTDYWVSYMQLDDIIPFLPGFIFIYVLWFPYLALGGIAGILTDAKVFRRHMIFIGTAFIGTMIFCFIFPNGQDLRPDLSQFEPTLALKLLGGIYSADTNTNVLPSMHVLGTFAVMGVFFESEKLRKAKYIIPLSVLSVLITLSTVFVKQHSVLDVFAGLIIGAVLYLLIYTIPRITENGRKRKTK